jgi:nicotinamide mononucleotide (NMN) deamidase PncC
MLSETFINEIHASGCRMVLSITGGGSRAVCSLLEVPGGSASVLEAMIPYCRTALEQRLGGPVEQACSEPTARALAMASFVRAQELADADAALLVGIGATASLASNRPKRGPHRIHVAWQSAAQTVALSCELVKGHRARHDEEQLAAALILAAVAEACGVDAPLPETLPETLPTELIHRREVTASTDWRDLLAGRRDSVRINGIDTVADRPVLFPGAFNPLHDGHVKMAELAARRLGRPVTFELSVVNVDKRPLDFVEIRARLDQFAGWPVLLTRAATFVEKAQIASGATFVVGVDTVERIGQSRYYGGDPSREAAIEALAGLECRFLVFGRDHDGEFQSLSDIDIPASLRELCDEVSESEFRSDVSSTELRERASRIQQNPG